MTEPQTTTIVCRTFDPEGDESGRNVTVQILDGHVVVLGEDGGGITLTAQQANTMSRALAGFAALLDGAMPAKAKSAGAPRITLEQAVARGDSDELGKWAAEYAASLDYERQLHNVTKDVLTRTTRELYELSGGEQAHARLRQVTHERDTARAELETARTDLEQMKNGHSNAWLWHGAAVKGYDELYEELAKAQARIDDLVKGSSGSAAVAAAAKRRHDEALDKVTAELDDAIASLDWARRQRETIIGALIELAGGESEHDVLRRVIEERDEARAELAKRDDALAEADKRWAADVLTQTGIAQCSEALVKAREEADEARRANDALLSQRGIDLTELDCAREDLEQAESERDQARAMCEAIRTERNTSLTQLNEACANHAIVLACWSASARALDAANEAREQAVSELRTARANEQPSCQASAQVPAVREVHEAGTTDLRGPWAMVGRVSGDANHGDGEPVDAELSEVIVRLVNGSTTSAPVAWAGTPPINLAIGYPFVGMEDRAAAVVTLGGIMLQPDNARTLGRYLVKAADHVAPAAPTIGDIVHERVDRFIDDARSLPLGETAELRATLGRGTPGPDGSPRMWASFDLVAHELSGDCHLIGADKGGE